MFGQLCRTLVAEIVLLKIKDQCLPLKPKEIKQVAGISSNAVVEAALEASDTPLEGIRTGSLGDSQIDFEVGCYGKISYY